MIEQYENIDTLPASNYYKKLLKEHLRAFNGVFVIEAMPRLRDISYKQLNALGYEITFINKRSSAGHKFDHKKVAQYLNNRNYLRLKRSAA